MAAKSKVGGSALLILDMISEFKFEGASQVLRRIEAPARAIARLKERATDVEVPIIYVNDTAGEWESDQRAFVSRCCAQRAKGRAICSLLQPRPADYFIFKPKHSGFYDTPLQTLLERLHVRRLIFAGTTVHQCVLFTAVDAYVRDFSLCVAADCVGGGSAKETSNALFLLKTALKADVVASRALRF